MSLSIILLSVASIWGVAVVTPGPNFFITARTTVRDSRMDGLFIVLGIGSGTMIWAIAGYFGIAQVFMAAPWLYTGLKLAGGSYIIWLGINMILKTFKPGESPEIPKGNSANKLSNWRKGLVTILSNPKTAMFITSLFASVLPKEPTLFTGLAIISLMVSISLAWYTLVVFIFSSPKFRRGYNRMQQWLEGFAGIIFIGFGARLMFSGK